MFDKYIRVLTKSYHNRKFTRIIKKAQSQSPSINLNKIIPDNREQFDSTEQKIKAIGTRILSLLQKLSEEKNIEFSLAYGTMLGAIRHKGFIPWDDDIDIFMTKSEFKKLISNAHELPKELLLFPMDVDFFKLMDTSSIVSYDKKRGVAVDIFIINDSTDTYHFYNVHSQRNLYFKKKNFFPLKKTPFESLEFYIPKNYHELLTKLYGNYMELPPENKRISHHSNFEKVTIENYGEYLVDKNNLGN